MPKTKRSEGQRLKAEFDRAVKATRKHSIQFGPPMPKAKPMPKISPLKLECVSWSPKLWCVIAVHKKGKTRIGPYANTERAAINAFNKEQRKRNE